MLARLAVVFHFSAAVSVGTAFAQTPAAATPAVFPADARVAYVDVNRVAALSRQAEQEAMRTFGARLFPIIGDVAKAKRIWAVFAPEIGNSPVVTFAK